MKNGKPGTARDRGAHQLEYAANVKMAMCHQHNLSDDVTKPHFNPSDVMYMNQLYALLWAWASTMDAACRLQSAQTKSMLKVNVFIKALDHDSCNLKCFLMHALRGW